MATQQIVSCVLTKNSVDDAEMTSELIDIEGEIDSFYGDGAYDKKKCRKVVHQAGGKIIVPPPKNGVVNREQLPELISRN